MKQGHSNFCYRLRPMNEMTIDELDNHYLWFSKRSGFNDKCDANIGAFIEDTPHIKRGLLLRYSKEDIDELIRQMDNLGICCFTKKLPSKKNLIKFPNGRKSICVEYNKKIIEDYFLNKYDKASIDYWNSLIEDEKLLSLDKGYEGLFVGENKIIAIEYKKYFNGESYDIE